MAGHVERLILLVLLLHREADVRVLHAVGAVVLRFESERARFQDHVQIFRHEDDGVFLRIGHGARGGEDAVVHARQIREQIAEHVEARRITHQNPYTVPELRERVHAHAEPAAIFQLHALLHVLGVAKFLTQPAVNLARIRTARGAFTFKTIQFLKDLHGDPHGVILKLKR